MIATLWSVSDASTAELMRRFHGHLSAGMPKDEALRAAQVELIHMSSGSPDREGRGIGGLVAAAPDVTHVSFASPFRWAGFVLDGDWR